MSFSDLFYPDNPRRRQRVVTLCSRLLGLMDANFKATNDLIDMIHEHLPGKAFSKIFVNYNATIKQNCDVFMGRIKEIQDYIGEKNKKLKELLDPASYDKISDVNISFADKMESGRKMGAFVFGAVGTVAGIIMTTLIMNGTIFVGLVAATSAVAVAGVAGIALAVFLLGIDMIASAIIGAIERDKLEETITDLEAILDVFKPASYEYTKQILRVSVILEL